MSDINNINELFISSCGAGSSTLKNGASLSKKGSCQKLSKSADNTLIFCECTGSRTYNTSVDLSGDSPVFRCSCPSREIPCKHAVALMYEWAGGKDFQVADVPDDIVKKREKIAKRAENSDKPASQKKPNKAAAAKKLQKQREGLKLAESFVNDIFERGICSLSKAACEQYKGLAKQLGDYYLPEPQAIVNEIIGAAQTISDTPDDAETNKVIALCVRLSSTLKKSSAYIDRKLESGEVLPENDILYEEMGGIWKLTQLRELGLFKENCQLIQLAFNIVDDPTHKSEIDLGYWLDLESGEIYRTENIRPYKASKYINKEDAYFGIISLKELYLYPGSMNRRVRWEAAEFIPADDSFFALAASKADSSISAAVKKAKNELKNTLSRKYAAVLINCDSIGYASDGHGVLRCGDETIALADCSDFPNTCKTLKFLSGRYDKCAVFGGLFYNADDHKFYFSPFSVVTENDIIRL